MKLTHNNTFIVKMQRVQEAGVRVCQVEDGGEHWGGHPLHRGYFRGQSFLATHMKGMTRGQFTKWRMVVSIGEDIPSTEAISEVSHS